MTDISLDLVAVNNFDAHSTCALTTRRLSEHPITYCTTDSQVQIRWRGPLNDIRLTSDGCPTLHPALDYWTFKHDSATTSRTQQADIRSDSIDLPLAGAARMRFSQDNRISDLERYHLAVFAATLGIFGRNGCLYLPDAISTRNFSTARRAATSKSALDCDV